MAPASDPLLALLHGADLGAGSATSPIAGGAPPAFSHQSSVSSEDLRLPSMAGLEVGAPLLAIAGVTVHEARRDPRADAATDDELGCADAVLNHAVCVLFNRCICPASDMLRADPQWQRAAVMLVRVC